MRVRATMTGYYGDMLRYPGNEFDLFPRVDVDRRGKRTDVSAEDQFSHEWMERIDGKPAPMKKRVMPADVVPPPPPPSDPKTPFTQTSRVTPQATVATSTQTPEPAVEQIGSAPTGDTEVI